MEVHRDSTGSQANHVELSGNVKPSNDKLWLPHDSDTQCLILTSTHRSTGVLDRDSPRFNIKIKTGRKLHLENMLNVWRRFCFYLRLNCALLADAPRKKLPIQEAQSTVQARNSASQVSMNDVTGTERRLSAKSFSH